jgi:hypothetical protein
MRVTTLTPGPTWVVACVVDGRLLRCPKGNPRLADMPERLHHYFTDDINEVLQILREKAGAKTVEQEAGR